MANNVLTDAFSQKLKGIEGWLSPSAAEFTACLFKSERIGNVVEFGVYHGKYLALLYHLTADYNSRVVGFDAFIGAGDLNIPQEIIFRNIREACGDTDRLSIVHADTMVLQRGEVLKHIPEPIGFISVDAGHEADNLLNDISLAAELIAPGGIIAVDDAFNRSTPGAIEGTCRYFEMRNQGRLAPFAQCYNKLFLTTADRHAHFLDATRQYVCKNAPTDEGCANTLKREQENQKAGFVPRFFGWELVTFLGAARMQA
ncbi:MAG: class I SAM-dependent methyltransferase [Verrucomicrobia bacterium]|nr:class I SAM-dependent methyltransferase [Verrucomicrobiota bacterium]